MNKYSLGSIKTADSESLLRRNRRKSQRSLSIRTDITTTTLLAPMSATTTARRDTVVLSGDESSKTEPSIMTSIEDADMRAKILITRLNRSKSLHGGIAVKDRIKYRDAHSAIEVSQNPEDWKG